VERIGAATATKTCGLTGCHYQAAVRDGIGGGVSRSNAILRRFAIAIVAMTAASSRSDIWGQLATRLIVFTATANEIGQSVSRLEST
jgi:hypothetical protein